MPRWSLVLFVIAFVAMLALAASDHRAETQPPPEPTTTPTPTPTATPAAGVGEHLRALQRIAREHGGTRAAGSPGDTAIADYIEQRLRADGSGVAALLQIAGRLAGQDRPLRFAFWGAEEIGLVGSRRYVRTLSAAERRRIAAYVNLDMVGSPGGDIDVYDTDDRIETALRRELPRRTGEVEPEGNSDHASFEAAGIPVGGLFTGLDDCYHQRCDRLGSVDQDLAARAARATEVALLELSR